MQKQAEHVGTRLISDHIKSVDLSVRPFKAIGESGDDYTADTVIISTGAQAKWLGLPTEQKYQGFGVSGCATCDGFFFRNKHVMVIGGGNTAVEEALYLTNHASKVTLVHRRDSLRAEKILQERMFKHPKIEVLWDAQLQEVLGEEEPLNVTGARIQNTKTGDVKDYSVDGIFIAIGHKPNTDMFKGQLNMDTEGYLITKADSTVTEIEGVFACGDVQDKIYRQAVTAAGTGCMAALEAEKLLASKQ
jgi:thioredoxin reductase (NADPH)